MKMTGTFSEAILKFITEINENISGVDNAVADICRIMTLIADDIGLGSLKVTLDAPPNSFEPKGVKKCSEVSFASDVNEKDGVYKRYVTPKAA